VVDTGIWIEEDTTGSHQDYDSSIEFMVSCSSDATLEFQAEVKSYCDPSSNTCNDFYVRLIDDVGNFVEETWDTGAGNDDSWSFRQGPSFANLAQDTVYTLAFMEKDDQIGIRRLRMLSEDCSFQTIQSTAEVSLSVPQLSESTVRASADWFSRNRTVQVAFVLVGLCAAIFYAYNVFNKEYALIIDFEEEI